VMAPSIRRMWINQPATTQPFHSRHGEHVIVLDEACTNVYIYPLSGKVISQVFPRLCLSDGWPDVNPKTEAVLLLKWLHEHLDSDAWFRLPNSIRSRIDEVVK